MKKVAVVILLIVAALIMIELPRQVKADVIYGCYNKQNGNLRIVTDPSQCRPNEGSISWNEVGPPSTGAIKVFDANGVFLGMLLEISEYTDIFIPSLSKAIHINALTGDIVEKALIPPLHRYSFLKVAIVLARYMFLQIGHIRSSRVEEITIRGRILFRLAIK